MSVDERLEDLLLRWEELRKQGRQVTPEELCRDCPELVEELRHRIQALLSLDPALGAANSSTTGTYAPDQVRTLPEGSRPSPLSTRTLAGYEILGELGRGGMGVVYKARQISLNRIVALKVILAGEHAAAHQRERFRGEAESAARLQHSNIVQVYEIGEQDGCLYISLEYIDGGSLHDILRELEQPPLQAAALMEQLAWAVPLRHHGAVQCVIFGPHDSTVGTAQPRLASGGSGTTGRTVVRQSYRRRLQQPGSVGCSSAAESLGGGSQARFRFVRERIADKTEPRLATRSIGRELGGTLAQERGGTGA